MQQCKYIIGIDLGTSNSSLAWKKFDENIIHDLEIEQVFANNQIIAQTHLPSVIYFPQNQECDADRFTYQYDSSAPLVVGQWAREQTSLNPNRTITSAKSWLCQKNINPSDSILPWQSELEAIKISPVSASKIFLQHLRQAFEQQLVKNNLQADWTQIEVCITVPASFDEVARNLTHKAAIQAGFIHIRLLEEPQAAFYSWIMSHESNWKKHIEIGDVVLICDIGGGTTDFSLIKVQDDNNSLQLERISVGNHLLLGGDNIDLALAHVLKQQLEQESQKVDRWKFLSLIDLARQAKEKILSQPEIMELPITVASKGSSLFATVSKTILTRDTVEQIVLNGFFAKTKLNDLPASDLDLGLNEIGLNYESEPCISKHLAEFLQQSQKQRPHDSIQPTKILFNGGVFHAGLIQQRILELLNSWFPEINIEQLNNTDLQTAVSKGATFYGHVRNNNQKLKIKSGTTKSYYLGIAASGMAIPGIKPTIKGICVVPKGSEEGSEFKLSQQKFGLVTGKNVNFRFFSSSDRSEDQVGTIISDAELELEESANLSVIIPQAEIQNSTVVPVSLQGEISDVGTLHLYMVQTDTQQKWDLQFNVRDYQ